MRCLEQLRHLNPNLLRPLLSLLLFFGISNALTVIKLKDFSKVSSEKIYLKDVAYIKTDNPQFKNFLQSLQIEDAPKPEKTKLITREKVIGILKKNYLDLRAIKILGNRCIVISDFIKLEKSKIQEDIENFLRENFPNINVISMNIPVREVYVPKRYKKQITVESKTKRYIHLKYSIISAKNLNIPVSVKYSQKGYVVKAIRDIKRGEKITEEDIKTVEMFNVRDSYIRDVKQVVGKIAKVNIKEGSILKKNQVIPDYAVKKKDKVKVIYDKGFIRVELLGVALENGEVGETIRVKNLSSGKEIKCKVTGIKEVTFYGSSY